MAIFGMNGESGVKGVRLYKCTPGVPLHCVILSRNWELASLHWAGRSVLCAGDDCPLCTESVARVCGFVVIGRPHDPGLLQLSLSALERLSAACYDHDQQSIERADVVLTLERVRSTHQVQILGRWRGEGGQVWSRQSLRASVCVLHGVQCSHDDFPSGEPSPRVEDRVRERAKYFAGGVAAGSVQR